MVTFTHRLFSLLVSFADPQLNLLALMRSYHSVILKGFYHSMEDESAAHSGDEKSDNAGNRIDSQRADSFNYISRIGQAQLGNKHGRQNGDRNGKKRYDFIFRGFYQGCHAEHCGDGTGTAHERHRERHECDVALLCATASRKHRPPRGGTGKQLETNAQQDDAADDANHAQGNTEYS